MNTVLLVYWHELDTRNKHTSNLAQTFKPKTVKALRLNFILLNNWKYFWK